MNVARILGGAALMVGGPFLVWDLVDHSGFDRIETPFTGPLGVIGPLVFFGGLWLARGRLRLSPPTRFLLGLGFALQVLGLLPFVQPRILTPTPGHAGVGLSELVSLALMFGGFISFIVCLVLLLTAKTSD